MYINLIYFHIHIYIPVYIYTHIKKEDWKVKQVQLGGLILSAGRVNREGEEG
jgi:hypothetical protein